jgi:hypothetical protein
VVITRLADLGGAHGYSLPGRITILESLTPADTAAVLVHEFAHLCGADSYVVNGSSVDDLSREKRPEEDNINPNATCGDPS